VKTCPVCKFDEVCPFQDENRSLVERLIRYKSKDADKMNEENENFVRYDYIKIMLFM
jgi:autophagy-related protein 16